MRLMDAVLTEIKAKIDIVGLISSYVSLKKGGRNFRANCPFHNEKTPSFMVSPDLQIFKCFGCGAGGDIFSFVEKMEGLEFPEAVRMLADKAGVKIASSATKTTDNRKDKLYKINLLACEYFHFLLTKHKIGKRAREYLKDRDVLADTWDTFSLGYAADSWSSLSSYLLKKGYTASEVIDAGLSLPRKNPSQSLPVYDRFRSRLMIPLRDASGRVAGFSGRALGTNVEPKYLNSPESMIFKKGSFLYGLDITKQEIKKADMVILVEGQFDLITPYQEGFKNIVASMGTALTELQLNLLARFTRNITLAFDSDAAGSEAIVRSVKMAENIGFTVSTLVLPSNFKDPDEAVRRDKTEFKEALANTIPFYDYYLDMLTKDFKPGDLKGKKTIAERFLSDLASLENPITRSHYLAKLSGALDIETAVLAEMLETLIRKKERKTLEAPSVTKSMQKSREFVTEEYLLRLLIGASTDIIRGYISKVSANDFSDVNLKKVFQALSSLSLPKKGQVDVRKIRDTLDESTALCLDDIYFRNSEEELSREVLVSEIEVSIKELKAASIKREIKAISAKIKEAEQGGNAGKVDKLRCELQKITEKIK